MGAISFFYNADSNSNQVCLLQYLYRIWCHLFCSNQRLRCWERSKQILEDGKEHSVWNISLTSNWVQEKKKTDSLWTKFMLSFAILLHLNVRDEVVDVTMIKFEVKTKKATVYRWWVAVTCSTCAIHLLWGAKALRGKEFFGGKKDINWRNSSTSTVYAC